MAEIKYLDGAGLQYLWGKIVGKINSSIADSIAVADALIFKGVVSSTKSLPTEGVKTGWTYKVSEAGTYAGQKCEVGDMIIAVNGADDDGGIKWTVIQNNVDVASNSALGLVKGGAGNGANKFGVDVASDGAMTVTINNAGNSLGLVKKGTNSGNNTFGVGVASDGAMTVTIGNATGSTHGLMSPSDWTKLNKIPSTVVGSTTKPIYWNAGVPVACGDTLGVSITGNAATATTLSKVQSLWGNDFNGSKGVFDDIVFNSTGAEAQTSRGIRLNKANNAKGFIGFSRIVDEVGSFSGISLGWSDNPETDGASVRINNTTFTYKGYTVLHSNNFNNYAPKNDGTGASGTWGISISGNAATATKLNNTFTISVSGSNVTYDGSTAQTVTINSLSTSDIDALIAG